MSAARRWRRGPWLLAGGALTLIAVALLFGYFPHEPLRATVEARLQALTGPGSRVGSLRVRPFWLEVEVGGLVVEGPTYRIEAPDATAILTRELLQGRGLVLHSLRVDRPTIILRPGPPSEVTPSSAAAHVAIGTLDIRDAQVEYRDPAQGTATLSGVRLTGSVGSGTMHVHVAGGQWSRASLPLLGLDASLRITPSLDAHLVSLSARTARSAIERASGRLTGSGAFAPDVAFVAHFDAAEAASLGAAMAPARVGGTVAMNGRAWVEDGTLRLALDFAADALRLDAWRLNRLVGRLAQSPAGVEVSADAEALSGRVQASARRAGVGPAVEARLTLDNVSIGDLSRALALADAPLVQGRASGRLTVRGDPAERLAMGGDLRAAGRTAQGESLEMAGGITGTVRTAGDARVDAQWHAHVLGRGAPDSAWADADVRLRGRVEGALPPQITGTAQGPITARINQRSHPLAVKGTFSWRGEAGRFEAEAAGLGGKTAISGQSVGGVLRGLRLTGSEIDLAALHPLARGRVSLTFRGNDALVLGGEGNLAMDGARFGDVEIGPVRGTLTAQRGAVSAEVMLPLWNAELLLQSPREKTRVSGTVRLVQSPLHGLTPLLPAGPSLQGVVSGDVRFALDTDHPQRATVDAHVSHLEASRGAWAARAAQAFRLALHDEVVTVGDLSLTGDGFALAASGTAGLSEDSPLALTVAASVDLARLPVALPVDTTGTVALDVQVGGTRSAVSAEGRLGLSAVEVRTAALGPVRVLDTTVALAGDRARLSSVTARFAGAEVRVSGDVPVAALWPKARRAAGAVAADEAADLRADWSLDVAEALAQVRPGNAGLATGRVAGVVVATGGLSRLEEITALLEIADTTVSVQDIEVTLTGASGVLRGGQAEITALRLATPGSQLDLRGAVDLGARTLSASGRGTLDLRALSPFLEDAVLGGRAELDLQAEGPLSAPRATGALALHAGSVRLRSLPEALTDIEARLTLDDGMARVTEGSALLGGGPVTVSGQARLFGLRLADARLDIRGRDMALRYPPGMRTRLDADLSLGGPGEALRLGGTVRVQRGLYDLDQAFDESLRAEVVPVVESEMLRGITLDIKVETEQPVQVRNDLVQLQANGRLGVSGDLQAPAPVGTLEVEAGGRIVLQGRAFAIERGSLAYEGGWDPRLDVTASHVVRTQGDTDVEVRARLAGTLAFPSLTFTSDPALSERKILALLATGREDDVSDAALLRLAGEQAAALLAGRLGRGLRGLGLGEVRVSDLDQLVGDGPKDVEREGEADLGARLTVVRSLSPGSRILYSLSLDKPERRYVQAELRPGRAVTLSGSRNDEGSFTAGAGQRFSLGGSARAKARSEPEVPRLSEVRFEGDVPAAESLRGSLKARKGRRRTIWQLQDDADALRLDLQKLGYLEAEVGARLVDAAAVLRVRTGPRYVWRVSGLSPAPDLSQAIGRALFEEEALERGRARLLETLHERGHLRATVAATAITPEEGVRQLEFAVRPGARVVLDSVRFPGAEVIASKALLEAAGGASAFLTEPEAAKGRVEEHYRRARHPAARVGPVTVIGAGERVSITVPVQEGPRSRLASVRVVGASRPQAELQTAMELTLGTPYEDGDVALALDRLRTHYFGLGHPAVRIAVSSVTTEADVALVITLVEGARVTVGRIVVEGGDVVGAAALRRRIRLQTGDPLDPRALARVERDLSSLPGVAQATAIASDENPATVTVRVREADRFVAGYLLTHNTDLGNDLRLDGEVRNLPGQATLGGRYRLGADVREARTFVRLAGLAGLGGDLTAVGSVLDEDLSAGGAATGGVGAPRNHRRQTEAQLKYGRPLGALRLETGYRYKRVQLEGLLDVVLDLAGVDASAVLDRRDNPLDARRGHLLSLALHYAPAALGSDFTFGKAAAQAFLIRPLTPSWTWAQGYRVGIGRGFSGQSIRSTERFFAGGSNTVRGFDTNALGPRDAFGDPRGGEAYLVLNQELRYRHRSSLGAVAFYDAGNVFPRIEDLSLSLRHSLGAGVRWQSPVGLLRLDAGVPLKRRDGEKAVEFSFSLGQAF